MGLLEMLLVNVHEMFERVGHWRRNIQLDL